MAKPKHSLPKNKPFVPMTPTGGNFRKDRYVPYILRAEIGIHEAALILPELTDADVQAAVRELIGQLQQGRPISQPPGLALKERQKLVGSRMRENLELAFRQSGPIANHEVVGCLRVILDSIDAWTGRPLGGRGYLGYLAGFLRKAGVEVRQLSQTEAETYLGADVAPPAPKRSDTAHMTLAELGHYWVRRDAEEPELIDDFWNRVTDELDAGRAHEVEQVCKALLGKSDDDVINAELHYHLGRAYAELDRTDEAIEALQIALEYDEGLISALDDLAQIYAACGSYREALLTWHHALEVEPNAKILWLPIAQAHEALGETVKQERALRHYVEHRGSSAAGLAQLASCLERQGKDVEANLIRKRIAATVPSADSNFEEWVAWLAVKMQLSTFGPSLAEAQQYLDVEPPAPEWITVLHALGLADPHARPPSQERITSALAGIPSRRNQRVYRAALARAWPDAH
jgi:tetratricopeptide (TPR) repeat protein